MKIKEYIISKIFDKDTITNLIKKETSFVRNGSIYSVRPKNPIRNYLNLIYAIVNKRANAIANLQIEPITIDGKELPVNHWIYGFLKKANPFQTFIEFLKQISYSLDYYGNAFIGVEYKNTGDGYNFYVLPTRKTEAIIDSTGKKIYTFKQSVDISKFSINDIIHIKEARTEINDVSDILNGVPSNLIASSQIIGIEKEILEFIFRYFERDTVPPLVLKVSENFTDEEWQQFKTRWQEVSKDYQILGVLENGGEIEPVIDESRQVTTIKDIDEAIMTRLCSIWGVPMALITSKYQNRDTAYLQLNDFYTNTIYPIANNILQEINDFLKDENIELVIKENDYSDKRTNLDYQLQLFQAGVITRDELREYLGLSIENNTEPKKTKSIKKRPDEIKKSELTNEFLDEFYDGWLKKLDRDETTMQEALKKTFSELEKYINDKTNKYRKSITKDVFDDINIVGDLKQIIDENEINEIVAKTTQKARELIAKEGIEKASKLTNFHIPELDLNEMVKTVVGENFDKIKISSNSLTKELVNILRNIVEGGSYFDIDDILERFKKEASEYLKSIKMNRIKTIARTVTTAINGTAQSEVWSRQGLKMMWLSSRDKRVRDDHKTADKQMKFSLTPVGYLVGGEEMPSPARGNKAENNVNCRCIQFPIKE